MIKWFIAPILLITFSACNKNSENKLIPREDLIPLLVELHITDAIAVNHTINENLGRLDSAILYGVVMEKHGYTKEQLEYTMSYYSSDFEIINKIYDEVFAELSKQSEEAKEFYKSASPGQTLEIWTPETKRFKVNGKDKQYPEPFEIDIDTTGIFVIKALIDLNPQDAAKNPRIEAYFYNPADDREENRVYFEELVITKTYYPREYMIFRKMENPELKALRLTIPKYDNQDSLFLKGIEIKNLHVGLLKEEK